MTDPFPRLSKKEKVILDMLIHGGELYGLEMVKASAGELKRGTIYVTLGRMVERGYITSRTEPAKPGEQGMTRRKYRPTGLGERVVRASEHVSARLLDGWVAA